MYNYIHIYCTRSVFWLFLVLTVWVLYQAMILVNMGLFERSESHKFVDFHRNYMNILHLVMGLDINT
jgi:hypothetical protein